MSEKSKGQLSLFSTTEPAVSGPTEPSDQVARDFATDPRHNVVLVASAGTGKTSVLVARYLNLLRAGAAPANILAITFTRQAAAEMRERIINQLRAEAKTSVAAETRWNLFRDRLGEVAISTVDSFCFSLLREFPLEADLDPGFAMADEIEIPRLVEEAVERALSLGSVLAKADEDLAMLLAQLGAWRTRNALTSLLGRRLVVPSAMHRFLAASPGGLSGPGVCTAAANRLVDRLAGARGDLDVLLDMGPSDDPRFALVARDLRRLSELTGADAPTIRASLDRMREFFLTRHGTVRVSFRAAPSDARARRRYRAAGCVLGAIVRDVLRGLDRDLNLVMARSIQRLFGVAVSEYLRALEARALLDFSDVLQRAVDLLRQMDEFARSRYRLESRYHHVLVDEFQDTSRAQWELVSLLVRTWGEGSGLLDEAAVPPSIFIVGDRKQSIYRFRDADVSVLQSATDEIAQLRPDDDARRSITHSFRAVPGLLAFVNDLFEEVGKSSDRPDAFRYGADDRFPVDRDAGGSMTVRVPGGDDERGDRPVGLVVADDIDTCARLVAEEVETLLRSGRVREKKGPGARAVRPADIAVLFRARASHREFERALERRSIPTYVYKGLGFFDADEIKDVRAVIRFLANPASELRAAALLRSRFVGLSDPGLMELAGCLSETLTSPTLSAEGDRLGDEDRKRMTLTRAGLRKWLPLVDRVPPADLVDLVLLDAAYARELRGTHVVQARENLKKMRSLLRRLQNRGYATMARISDQVDHLSGDMSTAVIEAFDAVNLMTVHASKGLEFPVVFLVDLGRGTGNQTPPVRVVADRGDGHPSVTVWPYRSQVDEDERQRNVEETKRLLYVAATRARDRLYLSTVLHDGRPVFNRGSFGEVLPAEFTAVFEQASVSGSDVVCWTGPSGHVHELGTHPESVPATGRDASRVGLEGDGLVDVPVDVSPVAMVAPVARVVVTGLKSADDESSLRVDSEDRWTESEVAERLVGRAVHELLRSLRGRRVPMAEVETAVRALLREVLPLQDEALEETVSRAVSLYARFSAHPDVARLAESACLFEVPFSYHDRDTSSPETALVIRGTIDCLVRSAEGFVTVLEFKTGRPRPEHASQLARYMSAARVMFPATVVEGRLVYP